MQILFLGTSAGRPTKERNVTSIALSVHGHFNRFWLFDAGEGTQHRLLETKLKLNKLERIFITHLHGDHLYGLPGLLCSRSYFDGAGPLQIYGPTGIRDYIESAFRHSSAHLDYELEVTEIEAGRIIDEPEYQVEVAELDHRILSFGYRIVESPQSGKLDTGKLARLGVQPGPLYGKLKNGEDVTLPTGQMIHSAEVVGPTSPGRIVTILGDTRPCANADSLARVADLLVHEATFAGGMEEKANEYGHSTIIQAAQCASNAQAKKLVVTHFSSRFGEEDVARLVEDASSVFPDTVAAYDYLEVDVLKGNN
ncbi:ribonuclease Z [Cohnella endophytica]|uniref:Ribonuclease Z n=1 Tax=Cohnella endophytica TaxID=2419778 RepID=A0A494Y716_9BACL|nr:ribonuclease Z [Cohnella endophytica]RKP58094.1 ribonuclease Z [Cohnella endophytica]